MITECGLLCFSVVIWFSIWVSIHSTILYYLCTNSPSITATFYKPVQGRLPSESDSGCLIHGFLMGTHWLGFLGPFPAPALFCVQIIVLHTDPITGWNDVFTHSFLLRQIEAQSDFGENLWSVILPFKCFVWNNGCFMFGFCKNILLIWNWMIVFTLLSILYIITWQNTWNVKWNVTKRKTNWSLTSPSISQVAIAASRGCGRCNICSEAIHLQASDVCLYIVSLWTVWLAVHTLFVCTVNWATFKILFFTLYLLWQLMDV